ncbi:hypothetical protein O9929_00055 [Vibrio lentus]|nr:hypothetical protein [Vibrio lentus]
MTNRYERMLGAVMQHRPVFIGFAIIVFASLPRCCSSSSLVN